MTEASGYVEMWPLLGEDPRPDLTMPCPSCTNPQITFKVNAIHGNGVTRLHGITACPDCDDPKQIVVEWRNEVEAEPMGTDWSGMPEPDPDFEDPGIPEAGYHSTWWPRRLLGTLIIWFCCLLDCVPWHDGRWYLRGQRGCQPRVQDLRRRLMGYQIYKEAPDVDYYIVWSSYVEAPVFGGTRKQVLPYLWDLDDRKPDRIHDWDESHPENRLKRTDEHGTSALWGNPRDGAWGDTGEIYQQQGSVTRANLFVLTRRLSENENADVSDLIEPFED